MDRGEPALGFWGGILLGGATMAFAGVSFARSAGALHTVDNEKRQYTVVITGSTQGLGRAMAKEFLQHGDNVVINGRSTVATSAAVWALKRQRPPGKVMGVAADVGDPVGMETLAAKARDEFGRIDFWIANAGATQTVRAPLHEVDPAAYERIVTTNLLGAMHSTRAAVKAIEHQSWGHGALRTRGQIFLVEGAGSRGGGTAMSAAYGASKAAIPQLAKSLRKELRPKKIGVHLLSPGMVMTDLLLRSSRDNPRALKIFNILAEEPETVARWLVPRIRGTTGTQNDPIRYLTPPGVLFRFLTASSRENRLINVDKVKAAKASPPQ